MGFHVKRDKDVDWVFVDNECYPRPGGLYADHFGVYGDNQVRTLGQNLTLPPSPLPTSLFLSLYLLRLLLIFLPHAISLPPSRLFPYSLPPPSLRPPLSPTSSNLCSMSSTAAAA